MEVLKAPKTDCAHFGRDWMLAVTLAPPELGPDAPPAGLGTEIDGLGTEIDGCADPNNLPPPSFCISTG